MVFSHRIAALAAVVVIPLGIAATSYALTDSPESPKVPPKVELGSGSPPVTPTATKPAATPTPTPTTTPSDQVVSRPPVSDDDDDDGPGDDARDDDGPGDDGPEDDG
ncbi:small secreted hydrophilic protein [Streptomyces beigongshangae]|uniref:small secreted hydrophilic protein n=1 Tax=Streptomyces beigongshangae TaxID=2841597 RepID=UPI001C8533C2|nr:small secreted hydrophilic protein [Streptomyces sp. REN17]